jgi:chromosome partitioning protein
MMAGMSRIPVNTARVSPGLGWPGVADDQSGPLGWPGDALTRKASNGVVSRETEAVDVAAAARATESTDDPVSRETGAPPIAQQLRDEARRRKQVSAGIPRPRQTRILTVANQKGGVGKTTSAVNLAAALAQAGARVLVIDMDPQGNASTALGVPHQSGTKGVYDVLIDGLALEDVVQPCPSVTGLFCAPATIDLAGAEIELVPLVARESRLRKAVDRYLASRPEDERIDYVFIDCPPSLGLLTVNAFVAAREVLIPIQCEYYALEGLSQLLTNIELIREHLNPELRVSSIVLTMYDARTRLSAQVADEVRAHFPDRVMRTTVPRSVRISEAPSHGETVITYDPTSTGALCYQEVAAELAAQDTSGPSEGEAEGMRA